MTRFEVASEIRSISAGTERIHTVGGLMGQGHGRSGDHSAAGVGDRAINLAIALLSPEDCACKPENCNGESSLSRPISNVT